MNMKPPNCEAEVASHGLLDRVVIGVRWNYRYGPIKQTLKESLSECGSAIVLALVSILLVPLMILALAWNVTFHFVSPFWFAVAYPKRDLWEKHKRFNAMAQTPPDDGTKNL